LLLLIRAYLELDMFASLRNPTETLVKDHEAAIQHFGRCLKVRFGYCFYLRSTKGSEIVFQEYMAVTTNTTKNWDAAPKVHTHLHSPDNVRDIGATVNGTTKTFEVAHGPIHDDYTKTNFKDIGVQVSSTFLRVTGICFRQLVG
jgi:hypothetical protein